MPERIFSVDFFPNLFKHWKKKPGPSSKCVENTALFYKSALFIHLQKVKKHFLHLPISQPPPSIYNWMLLDDFRCRTALEPLT